MGWGQRVRIGRAGMVSVLVLMGFSFAASGGGQRRLPGWRRHRRPLGGAGGQRRVLCVTKRVHHLLHGQPGDEGELDEPARASYRQTLKETLESCSRGSSLAML